MKPEMRVQRRYDPLRCNVQFATFEGKLGFGAAGHGVPV